MDKLLLGQAVKMRDQAVEFRAQLRAAGKLGHALLVAFDADLLRQVVEFRRRANQPRGTLCDGANAVSRDVSRGAGIWYK